MMTKQPTMKTLDLKQSFLNSIYVKINDLQPSLQVLVRIKSLELTVLQFALQDRVCVFIPSPHDLLQDDHSPQNVN